MVIICFQTKKEAPKIDPKADILSSILPDTTDQHGKHLFDSNCKVCTGKLVPHSESPEMSTSAVSIMFYILAWEFFMQSCLKQQNPCSNHEIHVLFEHGFYLKTLEPGPDLHA